MAKSKPKATSKAQTKRPIPAARKATVAKAAVKKAAAGKAKAVVKKPAVKKTVASKAKPARATVAAKPTKKKPVAKVTPRKPAKAAVKPARKPAPAKAPVRKAVATKKPAAKPAKATAKPVARVTKPAARPAKPVPPAKPASKVQPAKVATTAKAAPAKSVPVVAKPVAAKPASSPPKAAPAKAPAKAAATPPPAPAAAAPEPVKARPKAEPARKTAPTQAGIARPASTKTEKVLVRKVTNLDDIKLPEGYKPSPTEEYMNPMHLCYFKHKLEAWRRELLEQSQETVLNLRTETRDVGDEVERANREADNILELRTRDRERKLLRKIEEALKRIEDGSYGYCEETGDEIGLGRLDANPRATLTVDAQERREAMQRQFRDDR